MYRLFVPWSATLEVPTGKQRGFSRRSSRARFEPEDLHPAVYDEFRNWLRTYDKELRRFRVEAAQLLKTSRVLPTR
jgi:hypothetical protein